MEQSAFTESVLSMIKLENKIYIGDKDENINNRSKGSIRARIT